MAHSAPFRLSLYTVYHGLVKKSPYSTLFPLYAEKRGLHSGEKRVFFALSGVEWHSPESRIVNKDCLKAASKRKLVAFFVLLRKVMLHKQNDYKMHHTYGNGRKKIRIY